MIVSLGSAGQISGREYHPDTHLSQTLLTYKTAYRCHVFFTISNVYIQAVLSVILTFVLRQHVLKLNKHGNVNKSLPMKYLFLNSWAGK